MEKKQKQQKQSLKENRMTKQFVVNTVSFSREGLEDYGYDTSKVDDDTMEQFVSEMGDAFKIDLPSVVDVVADHVGIPIRETENK